MGIPRLEKFCCLFDSKTGYIIFGCINAILSFILFVSMVVLATELDTMAIDTTNEIEFIDTTDEDATLSEIYAMSVILVFMFLAKMLFDWFFIYGVIMERPGINIIKAYFILWTVFTLLSVFTFFLNSYGYSD